MVGEKTEDKAPEYVREDIAPDFVKEIRITVRASPYLKRIADNRAKELGVDRSKYIRSLIKNDVKKNKGKELF